MEIAFSQFVLLSCPFILARKGSAVFPAVYTLPDFAHSLHIFSSFFIFRFRRVDEGLKSRDGPVFSSVAISSVCRQPLIMLGDCMMNTYFTIA